MVGVERGFGRLQGVLYGNGIPNLAQTICFETLPSPAVMYWHFTKKHTVQDKGFWQLPMYVKYCTLWEFIMWLAVTKKFISHLGT